MLFKLIFFTLTSLCVGTLGQITTDLWLLGNYNNSVEGTLISSDAPAATAIWAINCAKNGPDCSLPPNLTVTEGPATLAYSYALHSNHQFKVACQLKTAIPTGNCALTIQHGSESSIKTTEIGQGVLNQVPITLAAQPSFAIPTMSSTPKSVGTIALNNSFSLPTNQAQVPSNSAISLSGGENKPTQSYSVTPIHSNSGSSIYLRLWKLGPFSIVVSLLLAT